MKLALTLVLTLLFLALESVAVKYVGLGVARIDVTVAIVAFLSLRAGLLEGAVASYAVGYLLDLMTGRPTGLYTLPGGGHLPARPGGRRRWWTCGRRRSFALFAMAADATHGLLAWGVGSVSGKQVSLSGLSGLPLEVLLTGLAALVLYPLLKRFGLGAEKRDPGLLRPMTLGQTSAGKDLKARYLWLGLVMLGGLLLLAGRLYRLQITRGDEYAAKSVANFVKEIRVKADRGIIKDRARGDPGRQPAVVRRLHHPGVLRALLRRGAAPALGLALLGRGSACARGAAAARGEADRAVPAGAGAAGPQPRRAGHPERPQARAAGSGLAGGAPPQLPDRNGAAPTCWGT